MVDFLEGGTKVHKHPNLPLNTWNQPREHHRTYQMSKMSKYIPGSDSAITGVLIVELHVQY